MSRARLLSLIGMCLLVLSCGSKKADVVRLSGIVFNYSQETVTKVRINGVGAGASAEKVKIGGVKGGGGSCCFPLEPGVRTVDVVVELWDGSSYAAQAEVEPWPDLMHYAIVHVLPGRKVVVEVTPGMDLPRKDLVDAQIKALGLKQEVPFSHLMRSSMPEYTGYLNKP